MTAKERKERKSLSSLVKLEKMATRANNYCKMVGNCEVFLDENNEMLTIIGEVDKVMSIRGVLEVYLNLDIKGHYEELETDDKDKVEYIYIPDSYIIFSDGKMFGLLDTKPRKPKAKIK